MAAGDKTVKDLGYLSKNQGMAAAMPRHTGSMTKHDQTYLSGMPATKQSKTWGTCQDCGLILTNLTPVNMFGHVFSPTHII